GACGGGVGTEGACGASGATAAVVGTGRAAYDPPRGPRRCPMPSPRPRISVFPKCYFDEIYYRRMNYLDWLRQAATLGAEGVEHYDGFFDSLDDAGVAPVRRVLEETNQVSSLLCFSPDFTHPDAAERARQVE